MKRVRTTAPALLVSLVIALAGCSSGSPKPKASELKGQNQIGPYLGAGLDPAQPRPSFTLTDTNGRSYDFAARTAGRPTILFFGYTNCPDECPTAMADVASALRKSPDLRGKVSVVFVTTDPKRDTRSVMRRWLDRFDESFVGLTGTPEQLTAAQLAAHIPPATTTPGSQTSGTGGYDVAHSSLLLGYDANDRARVVYPPGSKVSDIASDLHLLAEKDSPT